MSDNSVRLAFERLSARAQRCRIFTFHDLRHEAITHLSSAGSISAEVTRHQAGMKTRMLQRYAPSIRAVDLVSRLEAFPVEGTKMKMLAEA